MASAEPAGVVSVGGLVSAEGPSAQHSSQLSPACRGDPHAGDTTLTFHLHTVLGRAVAKAQCHRKLIPGCGQEAARLMGCF